MRARRYLPWLIVVVGCGTSVPGVGRERGRCRSDGTCGPGLQCLSAVCVEVAGERCQQVGQRARDLLLEAVRTRPLLGAAVGAMPERIAAMLTTACADDRWSSAAQRCVLDARDHDRVEACLGDLPPAARAALTRREAELATAGDRVERDLPDPLTAPPPIVPPITPPPPSTPLGPACEAYLAILTRYSRCPALPAQARTSIAEAAVTVRRTFAEVPPAARQALEHGCGQATSAMTGAVTQLGCP